MRFLFHILFALSAIIGAVESYHQQQNVILADFTTDQTSTSNTALSMGKTNFFAQQIVTGREEVTITGVTARMVVNTPTTTNYIFRVWGASGYPVNKDMFIDNYDDEFDPAEYPQFFPSMAPLTLENIVAGDKADKTRASAWDDWSDDVFDDWGYFYIYDVATQKYYFPVFTPLNQADGVLTTQTFAVFGRTYTIVHGWVAQGIFKFDITVSDGSQFRFGAYGNMGSDGSEVTDDYSVNYPGGTLYYRHDQENGDDIEELWSYFLPKTASENTAQPYTVFYDGDDMFMVTNALTAGVTIYFAKGNNVADYILLTEFDVLSEEASYTSDTMSKTTTSTGYYTFTLPTSVTLQPYFTYHVALTLNGNSGQSSLAKVSNLDVLSSSFDWTSTGYRAHDGSSTAAQSLLLKLDGYLNDPEQPFIFNSPLRPAAPSVFTVKLYDSSDELIAYSGFTETSSPSNQLPYLNVVEFPASALDNADRLVIESNHMNYFTPNSDITTGNTWDYSMCHSVYAMMQGEGYSFDDGLECFRDSHTKATCWSEEAFPHNFWVTIGVTTLEGDDCHPPTDRKSVV